MRRLLVCWFWLQLGLWGAEARQRIWEQARQNGVRAHEMFARAQRMLHAWLRYADPETLLLPDRLPGLIRGQPNAELVYTPHNSGADNYPYLILTAYFTDPALYDGRMREMLRNEIRYTCAPGTLIPANLDLRTRQLGPPSWFGAGEYAKDGLLAVTELLGRTPWYDRMVDLMDEFRRRAPIQTRFGALPDTGAELNGDVMQVLARLIPMTADPNFREWALAIGRAYVEEILPANGWLPGYRWNFAEKTDAGYTRLRDHGNEILVGLVLTHAVLADLGEARAAAWRPALRKMLDRVLASANPDGMLYNEVDNRDLKPRGQGLSDNWGYVYGAVYAFYQATGEERYREAVRRLLRNLPKYRNYDWESGSMDGLADSIEGAVYLVAREPVPEALDWIESEMQILLGYQQPDGTIERWYGDGNWNRTLLLYALMKTQGCFVRGWAPGVELGAVREGDRLYVTLHARQDWSGRLQFDFARHRRVLNLQRNYVRLNEWPEWYAVDENTLYRVRNETEKTEQLRLGSELKEGLPVRVTGGVTVQLVVEPARG
ncbi:MAG: hypothetical protein RMK57_02120 [Bryobacterales bacterium]|nr:hypothetical protein [Bryobacteraceae bacterium]MDW8353301.1 hypothetical protein [Bryobacterales bacterium]